MYFRIDPDFRRYFEGRLKQVFLYITDECNMRCEYCLYKPDLNFHLSDKEVPSDIAKDLISDFRELGAIKLTVMGGEPTLYDRQALLDVVRYAKRGVGYEYVRLDTNGMFDGALLRDDDFRLLDEITFSIDSPKKEVNDKVRAGGSLEQIVANMRLALDLNYNVQVTSTVNKWNAAHVEQLVGFLEDIGVAFANFHPIMEMGVARDTWVSDSYISADEWASIYSIISNIARSGKLRIVVRIPQRSVTSEEFHQNPDYYGYCPELLGERILVHPNGILRVCALTIGTPYCVGWFDSRAMSIMWNGTPTNELRDSYFAGSETRPCPKQRLLYRDGCVPLCISFKPGQKEIVYETIGWEQRKSKRR